MTTVVAAVCSPLEPEASVALLIFLMCTMSHMTIMSVRRTLSETAIE